MTGQEVVDAREATGWNLTLIPGVGPKWPIRCGRCPATFRARIPHVDQPTVQCPSCRTWNRLNLYWGP